jgi:serine/threonine-protein kinase RsbW
MSDETIQLNVPADHKYMSTIGACLEQILDRGMGIPAGGNLSYNLQLAVHEICTNIVDHAYRAQTGHIHIVFTLRPSPPALVVEIHDNGVSFDLSQVRAPALGEAQERGFGLFLVRQIMDEVSYDTEPNHNRWRLMKNLT